MIPEIKKILYTTDLSKNSAHAFRYAMYFAKKLGAEIIIYHVIEGISRDSVKALEAYIDKERLEKILENRITHTSERIQNRLKIFCEKALADDPECVKKITSIEVSTGYPEEEILRKVDALNCDAIIMGAHAKGITHSFLGTVAKRVLRRCSKPAFIIPIPHGKIDISFDDD